MSMRIIYPKIKGIDIAVIEPPYIPLYGESFLEFINPEHVIAGFVHRCLFDERVKPYFSGNINKFYRCFRDLVRNHPGALLDFEMRPDESFNIKVRNCLYDPISLKIPTPGITHYQASIRLIGGLNTLPIALKASARCMGSDFYDTMICDRFGRNGRTTRLKKGDLDELF